MILGKLADVLASSCGLVDHLNNLDCHWCVHEHVFRVHGNRRLRRHHGIDVADSSLVVWVSTGADKTSYHT